MVNVDLNASVFEVTSSDSDNPNFGSSFAFYRDFIDRCYFLTCRHVVMDVGGPDQARVGNHPAEMVASGSEGGIDDLAVLRVEDLPDVSLLQLSVSAETGSAVAVAGVRRFDAQSFMFRQIRGKLAQQISLQSRQRPGRVVAWDLTIEGEDDLKSGYSGAPVVDQRTGQVIAVASHRLDKGKGVAIAVETLENIWPGMLSEVQDSYPANVFSQGLGFRYSSQLETVEPAILQRFRLSSRAGFLTAATDTSPVLKQLRAFAVVRADGLGEDEIRQLVDKWYACIEEVGTARGGTDHHKYGHLFFLFDFGCPEQMVDLIKEVGAIPKPGPSPETLNLPFLGPPGTYISSYIVDFKEGHIHRVPAAIIAMDPFPNLETMIEHSTARFFPH
jgi:hypothetical protein